MIKKNKKNIMLSVLLLFALISGQTALGAKSPKVEGSSTPEVRKSRLNNPITPLSTNQSKLTTQNTSSTLQTQAVSNQTLGPNLVPNPSFQNTTTTGGPANWNKGGYGSNTRTFTYPVNGNTDTKAAQVTITNFVSGDAKWYFDDVAVSPGDNYQLSDYSLSNVPTVIDVRFKLSDGTFVYKDVAFINPSSTYQQNNVTFTVPANVVSLTVFHLIESNGSLSIDDFSLNKITTTSSDGNLVSNGNFETPGSNGLPQGWNKGGWGTNTRQFVYPGTSLGSGNSATINVTSFTTGDAKWWFDPVPVTQGIYTYSDTYKSNISSLITVQFINNDGTITYKDIASLPAASTPTTKNVDFSVSQAVKSVTVFHLIEGVGSLTIDNVSVVKKSGVSGVFSTGAVTLRFDDGWLSQFQNAIPKMQSAGVNGTFYIVSRQTADDGFPDFMSKSQIKQIYAMGNEIGAHTQTHPFLTQLSPADQQTEIQGSRNDLLALNVGPITSFAYPYGDYDSITIQIVKDAGFNNAVATLDGFVTPTSDRYQLEREGVTSNITFAQVKAWIDQAAANKTWLILAIHEVNNSGNQFSTTPAIFNQIVDYLVTKGVPVVTVSQGIQSLQ